MLQSVDLSSFYRATLC